jgi:hypothetical protein
MGEERSTGFFHIHFCKSSHPNEYLFPTHKNSKLWLKKTWSKIKKNWRISANINKKYTVTILIQWLSRKMLMLTTKCHIVWQKEARHFFLSLNAGMEINLQDIFQGHWANCGQ